MNSETMLRPACEVAYPCFVGPLLHFCVWHRVILSKNVEVSDAGLVHDTLYGNDHQNISGWAVKCEEHWFDVRKLL